MWLVLVSTRTHSSPSLKNQDGCLSTLFWRYFQKPQRLFLNTFIVVASFQGKWQIYWKINCWRNSTDATVTWSHQRWFSSSNCQSKTQRLLIYCQKCFIFQLKWLKNNLIIDQLLKYLNSKEDSPPSINVLIHLTQNMVPVTCVCSRKSARKYWTLI